MDDDNKTQRESTEPRSKEEIKSDLAVVTQEILTAGQEANDFFESLPSAEKKPIGDVLHNLSSGEQSAEQVFVSYTGNRDLLFAAWACFNKYDQAIKKQAALGAEYQPFKVKEIEEQARLLSGRCNFATALKHYDESSTRNDHPTSILQMIDEAFFLRKIELAIVDNTIIQWDYSRLDSIEHTLKRVESEWEEQGFLFPKAEPNIDLTQHFLPKETAQKRRREIVDYLNRNIPLLDQFNAFCSTYRLESIISIPRYEHRLLHDIQSALDFESERSSIDTSGLPGNKKDIEYDPRLIEECVNYINRQMQQLAYEGQTLQTDEEYAAYLQRIIEQSNDQIYDQIHFVGIPETSDDPRRITKELIISTLKSKIPAAFLVGIKDITFTTKPPDIDAKEEPGIETLGEMIPHYDEHGNLSDASLLIYYNIDLQESDEAALIQKLIVSEVVAHEIGHVVHTKLAFTEMAKWEEVMAAEDVDVTAYVGRARKKGEYRKAREDFCESFSLYTHPMRFISSQQRYEYMKSLFYSRMNASERDRYHDQQRLHQEFLQQIIERANAEDKTPEMA